MGKVAPAETAIRLFGYSTSHQRNGVMDKIEQLSGYEKSDYLATLASILDATGHTSEAEEMRNRAQQLFEQSKKESESEPDGVP